MGKRGPKAADEFGDQKAVLSTRITPATRNALEAAAEASGRTISREVEHRLRRTFSEDKSIIDTLGGPKLYAMMRMIASAMTFAGTIGTTVPNGEADAAGDDNGKWLSQPDAYDRAFWATVTVLDAMRPGLPASDSDEPESRDWWASRRRDYGIGSARPVIESVGKAEAVFASPDAPLTEEERNYRRIAHDLGEMRNRLKGWDVDGTR